MTRMREVAQPGLGPGPVAAHEWEPLPGSATPGTVADGLLPAVPPELMSGDAEMRWLVEEQGGQAVPRRLVGIDLGIASRHSVRVLEADGQVVCRAACVPAMTSARDSALTWLGWERLTSVIPRPLLCLLTGLVQLLMVSTPRPFLFFGWIVALVTTLVVVCTFSTTAPLGAKISTAAIGLAIGAMNGTLVGGAAGRSPVNGPGRGGIGEPG